MTFSTFQLLYMTLAIDIMDGLGLSNTAKRWSASVIKMSGQMCSDIFKRRLAVSFKVIILT